MRALRQRVGDMLRSESFHERLKDWETLPGRQAINPLLAKLFDPDERITWRAVTAIGVVMSHLADQDMESARNVMRRLIWSLNDESGGIGWGSAEAMGEIMARHERLAAEYACILVSYIRPDCNPLENGPLERGVLWGIGRLAQARPQLVEACASHLMPYLRSDDAIHRGMALWALHFVVPGLSPEVWRPLLEDPTEIALYENGALHRCRVADLAGRFMGSSR